MSEPKESKNNRETSAEGAIRRMAFNQREREVLLKAIKRYRQKIPPYIKSNQAEIEIADEIIQKLSKNLK